MIRNKSLVEQGDTVCSDGFVRSEETHTDES